MPPNTTLLSKKLHEIGQHHIALGTAFQEAATALYEIGNDAYALMARVEELTREFPDAQARSDQIIAQFRSRKPPFP